MDNAQILVEQIQLTTGNEIGACKAWIPTMQPPQMQLSKIIFIVSKQLHKWAKIRTSALYLLLYIIVVVLLCVYYMFRARNVAT